MCDAYRPALAAPNVTVRFRGINFFPCNDQMVAFRESYDHRRWLEHHARPNDPGWNKRHPNCPKFHKTDPFSGTRKVSDMPEEERDWKAAAKSFKYLGDKCHDQFEGVTHDIRAGGGLLRHLAFRGRRLQYGVNEPDKFGAVSGEAPGKLMAQHVLADDNQGRNGAAIHTAGGFSVDVWQSRLLNNKAWYMSNGGDGTGGAVHAEGWAEVSHQTLELDRYGSLVMANSYLRGNYAPPKVAKTVVRTPVDSPANS